MKNNDISEEKKVENQPASVCTSVSELIDRLCTENVRLWHIWDDIPFLQKELEKPAISENAQTALLEKIAENMFETFEVGKRRSGLKKAIDEIFILNVKALMEGRDVNVCNEIKNHGRTDI